MSPIRRENRERYPENWDAIRSEILARAGNRCEFCGIPKYAVGYRERDGTFVPLCGNGPCDAAGQGRTWPALDHLGYAEAREIAEIQNEWSEPEEHWIVIVLTVAHLDHQPENCKLENLRALCQRCHNRHDGPERRSGVRARAMVAQIGLFGAV